MTDDGMLTNIDAPLLASAFPLEVQTHAILAASHLAGRFLPRLHPRQWTERFAVQVAGQSVLIPARLHFASHKLGLPPGGTPWLIARALQTRSKNGFARQDALRDLLREPNAWTAPYIIALIGEYVVEILQDIYSGVTIELEQTLAEFIVHNPAYWATTKRRVMSYWSVYYRYPYNEYPQAYSRAEYVGFKLANRLDAAVARSVGGKSA
jgi:hypothetical protein